MTEWRLDRIDKRLFARTAGTPFAPNHNPRHSIAASYSMTVDGLKRYILSRLTNDDADITVTAGT